MKRRVIIIFVLLAGLAAFIQADIVNIDGLGTIEGTQRGDLVEYLGVPYAHPPVGDLRFKAPQPVAPFSENFIANRSVACIQAPPAAFAPQSEDCLVLNIYKPISAKGKLPVLFYIHGGAWKVGSGLDYYINATTYVTKENIVFIAINYRLDVLSYFSHKALTEEDPKNPTNFGLLDQRMALDWVSKHISFFNGDPDRITVMGDSAGAQSIVAQLRAWKEFKPKFQQAIIQSSYSLGTVLTLAEAENEGVEMVDRLGCTRDSNKEIMDCLRRLPAEELMQFTPNIRFAFFGSGWRSNGVHLIDDGVNFKALNNLLLKDFDLDMPIIIGSTANEGNTFSFMNFMLKSQTEELHLNSLKKLAEAYEQFSPTISSLILTNYTSQNPKFSKTSDPVLYAYGELITDSCFECATQGVLNSLKNRQNVYGYLYNYTAVQKLQANHGGDNNFVFGPAEYSDLFRRHKMTDADKEFAKNFLKYFASFVKTGVPSVPGKPTWPVYGNEGNLFVINNEFKVIHNYKRDICQIWIDNMPQGFKYTGVDYYTEEPLLSKVLNEYLIDLVFLGWRKRRFAKEAGIVLLLVSVVFWYNVVRCCRGRSKKNSKKILPPKKNTPSANNLHKKKTN
jgi:para-nitrobenzyl esterase